MDDMGSGDDMSAGGDDMSGMTAADDGTPAAPGDMGDDTLRAMSISIFIVLYKIHHRVSPCVDD